ncbi:heterokaryon incompatibility protein-domain-containing protein [Clohesyomyces aquaticus]|uniref:Heterokaryon incompatibility protein-domain-containing protein n=1 Tax=Clohesyomyces aquaticus TaxID=1231657 RepID=A0A1Y2A4P4_9PLEO|nr:heterokaryon incompatibility protein-domain-containing protein [Clohesyomyces aquaticus]
MFSSMYQYRDLDSSVSQIRLLHLHAVPQSEADNGDSVPACTLSYAPVYSSQPYQAISYVWGPPKPQKLIQVDGLVLPIGENLYTALQHFQGSEEVVLWIDAICINQDDVEEKSTQVQLMRDIYREAEHVFVWLGPGTPETDTAMYWLDKLGEELLETGIEKMKSEDLGSWDMSEDNAARMEEHELVPVKQALKKQMNRFLQWFQEGKDPIFWRHSDLGSRPWFSRAWCLQECSNGREVFFLCGDYAVEFRRLWATVFFLNIFGAWASKNFHTGDATVDARTRSLLEDVTEVLPRSTISIRRITLYRPSDERLSLKNLLCRVNVLKFNRMRTEATLPVDRVYALLGIANDEAARSILPDYSRGCANAYIAAAKVLLTHGHLDILSLCRKRAIESPTPLPSWVPDWQALINQPWMLYGEDQLFRASGTSKPNASFIDHETGVPRLLICAVHLDHIEHIGQEWTETFAIEGPAEHLDEVSNLFQDVSSFLEKSARYSPQLKEEGIWRIPICDLQQGGVVNWAQRATENAKMGHRSLQTLSSGNEEWLSAHPEAKSALNSYIWRLRRMHDARPFLSRSGYVGMCPLETMMGDLIVVVQGAVVPYVIKKVEEDIWQLVGECFTFGAMDGEAVMETPVWETFILR